MQYVLLKVGVDSFCDAELPQLESLEIGCVHDKSYNFAHAKVKMMGMELKDDAFVDLDSLKRIVLGNGVFAQTKQFIMNSNQ